MKGKQLNWGDLERQKDHCLQGTETYMQRITG